MALLVGSVPILYSGQTLKVGARLLGSGSIYDWTAQSWSTLNSSTTDPLTAAIAPATLSQAGGATTFLYQNMTASTNNGDSVEFSLYVGGYFAGLFITPYVTGAGFIKTAWNVYTVPQLERALIAAKVMEKYMPTNGIAVPEEDFNTDFEASTLYVSTPGALYLTPVGVSAAESSLAVRVVVERPGPVYGQYIKIWNTSALPTFAKDIVRFPV